MFIKKFKDKIRIINSKRKPMILTIVGSNDKEYKYLLKCDEDLRLDERIMQFFNLFNIMISKTDQYPDSFK